METLSGVLVTGIRGRVHGEVLDREVLDLVQRWAGGGLGHGWDCMEQMPIRPRYFDRGTEHNRKR